MRRLFVVLAVVAAGVTTQPLAAQTTPPRQHDSTQIKFSKARQDSANTLGMPSLLQYCSGKPIGGMKNGACVWFPRLLPPAQRSTDSSLTLSRQMLLPKTDTITRTIYDTVTKTVVDTVYVKPDTIVKPPVDTTPKPPVDTVKPPPLPVDTTIRLPALLNTAVSSTPATGRTINVNNLQMALDTALDGDRLVIPCVAQPSGNFILRPRRTGGIAGQWVTVTTGCTLPSEGTRTSPAQSFARISSPNVLPAIATNGAAVRWRFVGVEVTVAAGVATNQGLIALGCPSDCERDTTSQPRDIIFDRSYIHGTTTVDVRRCVGFNGARLAVIESWVSDCHSAFDAQAISGWNGPGPFKIVNNYLEGAAETIAFGGGDPVVPGLVPSDIEIRRNHITKPMDWKTSAWSIKNLVEFKIGRRVLIESNVIENVWPAGQNGFAFVLWSVNQQTTCTWCVTEHLTVQNNLIRNVAGGWSMVATGANGMPQYRAVPMNHVAIRNNVIIGLNNPAISGSSAYGQIFQISDTIQSLTIEQNTAFSPTSSSFMWNSAVPLPNHVVRNNLVGGGQYQIFSPYGQGQIAWDHAGGPGSSFLGNVVAMFSGGAMIPGNDGPTQWDWIGLAGGPSAAYSVTATLDDLAILPSSGYAKKGTDGRDPGADIPAVKAATNGVTAIGATVPPASTQRIQIRKP